MSNIFNQKIPPSPGIYFFLDIQDRILYIGKAGNLKSRLASYRRLIHIQGETLNVDKSRITEMLKVAVDLDWQETGSEIEALILESQLIKKHRPPYNVMLRDDKQYFFVGITREEFPRIFVTHQPTKSGNFIGPFTDGAPLKSTLKLLKRIFPFCTCKQNHHRYCLNYHIGNCLGFCCLKNPEFSKEQKNNYQKNIRAIRDILNGKKVSVVKNLEKEMSRLAQNGNFEKAIELRNRIGQLQRVFENAKVIQELAGRSKVLEEIKKIFDLSAIPERIEGYDISNIQGQFATGSMVVFTNGQPDKNEYRKFKIRRILSSEALREGGFGDTQMLAQMLSRRFKHPEWPFPDLIVIDGGKGQLNAADSVISKQTQNSKSPIPIIALTKDEKHLGHHVFISTKKEATLLKDLSLTVKNLILFVDSEAHRFAISYYRKLHRGNFHLN